MLTKKDLNRRYYQLSNDVIIDTNTFVTKDISMEDKCIYFSLSEHFDVGGYDPFNPNIFALDFESIVNSSDKQNDFVNSTDLIEYYDSNTNFIDVCLKGDLIIIEEDNKNDDVALIKAIYRKSEKAKAYVAIYDATEPFFFALIGIQK